MTKRIEGLYTNCKPDDQPEGYYRDALNISLDESVGAIVNELGTEELISVGNIIGHCVLANGNIILFEQGITDRILLYDGTNLTVIINQNLGFGNPITAVPYINDFNEYVVFWVDGINPPRYINIDNYVNASDVYLNLFPATENPPRVNIQNVQNTGGSLKTGAYYFAAAYRHKDGTLTNFYHVDGPAYITNRDPNESGQPGELTSKSIKLSLDNVDTNYEVMQIAVIRKIDGIFDSVELLPEIGTQTGSYVYTGNEAERPGALEEIQIDNAVYSQPKTIAYQDDNLYLGNLKEQDLFEQLQPYVNDVVIKPSVDKLLYQNKRGSPDERSFSNVDNASRYRGYRRGEVYAMYMSFIRKDGTETKAFHIPGRAPISHNGKLAESRITFFQGLSGDGLAAQTEQRPVTLRPLGNGTLTVKYKTTELTVIVDESDSRTNVADKIRNKVNTSASVNTEIEALGTGPILNFKALNPGVALNGERITITADRDATGRQTTVSDRVEYGYEKEPTRHIDGSENNFVFANSTFTFFGGTAAFGNEVSISIDTNELTETFTFSGLTVPSTATQLVDALVTSLNNTLSFSDKYLASREAGLLGQYQELVIEAKAVGDTYNGVVNFDPKNTSLNSDNIEAGSTYNVTNLNGGEGDWSETTTITDTKMYGGLGDLEDDRHFRFRSDPDDGVNATGMGYWENANETYPNDTEVWGDPALGGLAGKKVRHHHFPDLLHDKPFEKLNENEITLRPLGFKVENVNLPAELADEIIGYKVYYAKRGEQNKRILDSIVPICAHINNEVYSRNAENQTGVDYADDVFYGIPFSYMKDKTNVNDATHLSVHSNVLETERSGRLYHQFGNTGFKKAYENFRLDTSIYVDSEDDIDSNSGANLVGYGFNRNMNNSRAESKLVLKLRKLGPMFVPIAGNNKTQVANICSHKTDVFNSFDLQQLVFTNYIQMNKATSTSFADSPTIYGGDTFISPYSFRMRGKAGGKYDNLFTIFIESSDNINLRMNGDESWEYFYPSASLGDMMKFSFDINGESYKTEDDGDVAYFDNYLGYNSDYSELNDIKFPGLNPKRQSQAKEYPTRVIRNSGGIRSFKQDDYLDLNKSRGEITKLSNYNNILIPHMERALVRTRGKEDIQVGDMRAFLGTGDIFSVRPDDIIYTDLGFAGLQNKRSAISTPYGYFFFDDQSKRMYGLTNEGIADISENILPEVRDFSNVELGYNPKDEVIVTKTLTDTYSYSPKHKSWISRHSYSPDYMLFDLQHLYSCSGGNLWKHSIGRPGKFYNSFYNTEYKYVKNQPQSYKAGSLLIDSNTYLNYNQVITIEDPNFDYNNVKISDGVNTVGNTALEQSNGYNARLIASVLSNEINTGLNAKSFSKDNKIYIFSDATLTLSHDLETSLVGKISIVVQEGQDLNKNSTFDKFRIYNSYQDTELEDIEYFKDPIDNKLENIYIGNARNVLKYWVINKFRDVANIPSDVSTVDQWAYKRRMEDKYHIVKLIKDNRFNENVYLFGSDIVDKTSIR